ncbi:MAG: Elongation factor 4 [Thermoanaerobaculia bacterium]|nr:Elongation factor 4 [Thermoanaerobaculia bacterium]
MKTTSAKFTVTELAKMMGKPASEVLFLLQGIGVDVKNVESVLDPLTVQALLSGKTQAPRQLIVRQTPAAAPQAPAAAPSGARPKTERAALKRIKIVEKSGAETEVPLTGPEGGTLPSETGTPASAVETVVSEAAVESAAPAAVEPVSVPAPLPAVITEPVIPVTAAAPEPVVPVVEEPIAAPVMAAAPVEAPEPEVAIQPSAVAPEPVEQPAVAAETAPPAPAAEARTEPVPAPAAAVTPAAAPSAEPAAAPAPSVPAPPARPASAGPSRPTSPQRRPAPAPGSARPAAPSRPEYQGRGEHAGRGEPRQRPAQQASSETQRPAAAAGPAKPSAPGGALGRLLSRTGQSSLSALRPAAPPPSTSSHPGPASHSAPTSHHAHHAPHTEARPQAGQEAPTRVPAHERTGSHAGPAIQRPASPAMSGAPAARPAGVSGRAVVAPPTEATIRAVRAARDMAQGVRPAPPPRPVPARPGSPMPAQRTEGPGGRPSPFPRRPMSALPTPPPPPVGTEKRRKDAAKPVSVGKKDDVKKPPSKKPRTKEVSALEEDVREYLGSFKPDTYEDVPTAIEGEEESKPLSKSAQRRAAKRTIETQGGEVVAVKKAPTGPVFLSEGVTVKELSDKLGIMAKDLMKAFLNRGILATINQPLDPNLAVEVAREFGQEAAVVSFEEELELSRQQMNIDRTAAGKAELPGMHVVPKAPVVTVMGHVDHGKTSLLDAIRKANVAEGEAGGITQHIGAYRVETNGKKIVFLDTPGHEAFTMMRARGAKATDIVVLVVAADDGVMPQTTEAIAHARAAKVPIVVAINKIDKPNANTMRVKQELADKGVLVEEYGGETVSCEISAKKRIGIDQLLEMILLQADLLELKAAADGPARGVILEARRETGRGTLATVLVQQGTLKIGDFFFAGAAVGRVRSMLDDHGERLNEAGPATPVEVMGFDDIPSAGDPFVVEDEQKAREIAKFRVQKEREEALKVRRAEMSLDTLFDRMQKGETKELPVVVKADVGGSEEVLVQSLSKLSTEKVRVNVIHSGVGAISVNDIHLAFASKAIVIGFNIRPERNAQELADKLGVETRLYSVIYDLTEEIKKAMTGLLDTVKKEMTKGKAEVRDTFKIPKIGTIAGCMVIDGVIPRNASARLVRDGRVIYEGKIGSLKRFKDDASEVKSGFECGIGIHGYQDVKVGDVIEAFVVEEIAPSLT